MFYNTKTRSLFVMIYVLQHIPCLFVEVFLNLQEFPLEKKWL